MGQQQSKDEFLFQQVSNGNIEAIKALRSRGAGLEWIDSEGKTPLIAACMNQQLFSVAKTLIELGANVDAYRPGRHCGTPLHHAAKRGLEQTVKLLLSCGANALVMNGDCQTPLDIARAKGYSNVVRAIEEHVCLFSGWLRELCGPGFLELLAHLLLSRKVWVVVLPCGSRNLREPFTMELAIYAGIQDAQPCKIVPLWEANLEESNFYQPDPVAIISDVSRSLRIKVAPVHERETQQLQRFCNACRGIPQVMHPLFPFNNPVPTASATAVPTSEDEELAMAIYASLQSASHERAPHMDPHVGSTGSTNSGNSSSNEESYISGASSIPARHFESHSGTPVVQTTLENPTAVSIPSGTPVADAATDDGTIHYPSIDMSPLYLSSPAVTEISSTTNKNKEDGGASSCTICLDAPLEGACIPCGHMAGCMSCLNKIKAKKLSCPVCRARIDQVIRIYAV